jgi:flagellar biosynthesis component FlhA
MTTEVIAIWKGKAKDMPKLAEDICPYCKVNRTVLQEMLADRVEIVTDPFTGIQTALESQNHATARHLIDNCKHCKEAMLDQYRIIRER